MFHYRGGCLFMIIRTNESDWQPRPTAELAISHQPSAISRQPSAISHQPSAVSPQPPLSNRITNEKMLDLELQIVKIFALWALPAHTYGLR